MAWFIWCLYCFSAYLLKWLCKSAPGWTGLWVVSVCSDAVKSPNVFVSLLLRFETADVCSQPMVDVPVQLWTAQHHAGHHNSFHCLCVRLSVWCSSRTQHPPDLRWNRILAYLVTQYSLVVTNASTAMVLNLFTQSNVWIYLCISSLIMMKLLKKKNKKKKKKTIFIN